MTCFARLMRLGLLISVAALGGCKHETHIDRAEASRANADHLAKNCILYAQLQKDFSLPPHFASLFYDARTNGIHLNVYTTHTPGVPSLHTDWNPNEHWPEITAEVDRCSDYHYLGAGLRLPRQDDHQANKVVIFYSKSLVGTRGYIVGWLDGTASFITPEDLSAVLATSEKLRAKSTGKSAQNTY